MSDEINAPIEETPILNDAITADDVGFSSDAGEQALTEETTEEGAEVKAESVEELKEEVAQAIEDGATEEEVEGLIREYTIKVNGKEKTVKVDLNNEDDLVRKLQLAEAGRGAMQEAAELKKLYQQEIERLKDDPWKVLEELELDPDELAEKRIRSKIEELEKSPEQREREELQKQLDDAREQLRQEQEQKERFEFERLQAEQESILENEIDKALEAHEDLPKTPYTVAKIASTLLWAMEEAEAGRIDVDPDNISIDDVIPAVKQEIQRDFNSLLDNLGEKGFESYFGKKRLDEYRKNRLSNIKNVPDQKVQATTESLKKEEKVKKKVSAKDYFKNL